MKPLITDVNDLLLGESCWLAGGAIRSLFVDEKPNDYDLFFRSKEHSLFAKNRLTHKGYKVIFECPQGSLTTLKKQKIKIQLITEHFFKTPQEVIEDFDLIPGMAIVDKRDVYAHPQFLDCIQNKIILFHKITYPASTMKRVAKYSSYGYYLPPEASQFFINTVREMEPGTDWLRTYID